MIAWILKIKSLIIIISQGQSFHSFRAAATKALSPSLVLTVGDDKRKFLLDLKWYMELVLKVIRSEMYFGAIFWIALKVIEYNSKPYW